LGEELSETCYAGAAPGDVKFREGHTYLFERDAESVRVIEYDSKSTGVKINLDQEFNRADTLNGHSPGSLICGTIAEEVFVKEKCPDGDEMEAMLDEAAMETATSAALAPLGCFVGVRAIQVFKAKAWLAFEKLPGRTFDAFLDVLEAQPRCATEEQIIGAALLIFDAYCKLNNAGYQQRDVKSGNLWLYERDGEPVQVRVIDSDACLKIGHITDARDEGLSNEEWNLRALRDRKLWDLGGNAKNTCSVYCSNVDLMSKQCVPGEQAVVFSVSEIFLRMMGECDICYELQEDSTWEDVMGSTIHCDIDPAEDEEDTDDKEAEEKSEEDGDDCKGDCEKMTYSEAFRNLLLALRRRAFTQGGVDAFLDLRTATELCREFAKTELSTTQEVCELAFGELVREMATKKPVEADSDEEDDEEEEDTVSKKRQKWMELTEEEANKYFVCPISNQTEHDKVVKFKMVGLALREKRLLVPSEEEVEFDDGIFLKAPQFKKGLQRAALPTTMWWRQISEIGVLLDEIRACGGDGQAKIAKAMEKVAGSHKLCVNGDVLCIYLNVRAHDLFGDDVISSWPTVGLYPWSEKLQRSVRKALVGYRDALDTATPQAQTTKENDDVDKTDEKTGLRRRRPVGSDDLVPIGPAFSKPKPLLQKLPSPPKATYDDPAVQTPLGGASLFNRA
jgi:hypothetical protein